MDHYSGSKIEGLFEDEDHDRRYRGTRRSLLISARSWIRLCGHVHLDQLLKHSVHTKVVKATSVSRQLQQPAYVVNQRRIPLSDALRCINNGRFGGSGISILQSLQAL